MSEIKIENLMFFVVWRIFSISERGNIHPYPSWMVDSLVLDDKENTKSTNTNNEILIQIAFFGGKLLFWLCNVQLFRCLKSIILLCMSKLINIFVCRSQNKTFHIIKWQHGRYWGPHWWRSWSHAHTYWPMHNSAQVVLQLSTISI